MAKKRTTSFDDLPEELADNILLRLPVKALIRSTSVNKKWYSVITNPNFISAQIKHAISHCDDNLVLIIPIIMSEEKHCSLISVETSKLIAKFEVPISARSDWWTLVNSVDGLMLLTGFRSFSNIPYLYLGNPCLRTYRILVSSCFGKLVDDREVFCMVGLGFNKVANDYRVVRIFYFRNNMGLPKVEVYSLRKRTWKEIKDPIVRRSSSSKGVYVNGRFYWIEIKRPFTWDGGHFDSKDLWLLSFDFDTEVFGEVKVPEKVSDCLGVDAGFNLMEFDGSLALCVHKRQHRNGLIIQLYRIWLMRLDNGVISWILRFTTELKDHELPMNITKTGTILVETFRVPPRVDIMRILSCNLNTMHYKYLGLGGRGGAEDSPTMPRCSVDSSFVESLVMYEGGKSLLKFAK